MLLLLAHLVPLVLIAVCSGLFACLEEHIRPGENLGLVVARTLVVLAIIVSVAELVENAVLVPLCARGAKLPSLLLSWRGVALGSADQRMFHSWTRTKFTALQTVLLASWAVFWNVANPMGHGVSWGGRVYNGLVPNLLVCTLAVRAFFRQQWQGRAFEDIGLRTSTRFEDIDTLELWLTWACAVGIPVVNTAAFVMGAGPLLRHEQIEVEMLSGAEMYATFVVVGAALSMQTFELGTKLAIIAGNAAAVLAAGAVRAVYAQNWNELIIRRGVLCSIWTGFLFTHLVINRAIKPYWLRQRAEAGTCGGVPGA